MNSSVIAPLDSYAIKDLHERSAYMWNCSEASLAPAAEACIITITITSINTQSTMGGEMDSRYAHQHIDHNLQIGDSYAKPSLPAAPCSTGTPISFSKRD
ncbi:hypothetical protein ACQ5SB_05390 [Stenotrophomonas geniculata]|uniref:hypothetical protein n=1 Tax=Stenotrophomonas TaxID=40323 RepID=UPI003D34B3F7